MLQRLDDVIAHMHVLGGFVYRQVASFPCGTQRHTKIPLAPLSILSAGTSCIVITLIQLLRFGRIREQLAQLLGIIRRALAVTESACSVRMASNSTSGRG